MKKTKLLIVTLIAFVAMLAMFTTDAHATVADMAISFDGKGGVDAQNPNGLVVEVGTTITFAGSENYTLLRGDNERIAFGGEAGSNKTVKALKPGTVEFAIKEGSESEVVPERTFILTAYTDYDHDKTTINQLDQAMGISLQEITNKYFRVAKEWGKSVTVNYNWTKWVFESFDIAQANIDTSKEKDDVVVLKPNVSFKSDAKYPEAEFITFSQLGALPVKGRVTFDIGTTVFGDTEYGSNLVHAFYYTDGSSRTGAYIGYCDYLHGKITIPVDVSTFATSNKVVAMSVYGDNLDKKEQGNLEIKTSGTTATTTPVAPAEEGVISVSNVSTTVVGADAFKTAKASKEDVVVKAGNIITWTFDDKELQNTKIDFKPSVVVSNKKFDTIKTRDIKDGIFIDFTHSGELPGKADVSLNIGTEKYGTKARTLHLYYYNPETKGYEYKQPVQYKNGIAKFDLKHCSTYAIVEKRFDVPEGTAVAGAGAPAQAVAGKLDNEPKAGENTLFLTSMIALASLAVSVITRKK